MNEKFFSLPKEKQQAVLNAGYRVFSRNTYKKSPVSEIASEAGISKSLLFYYFKNKKELYLFLWETCMRITIKYLKKYGCGETEDFFEAMYRGLCAKIHLMEEYPDMGNFAVKVYYEKDPEISPEIQKTIVPFASLTSNTTVKKLDPEQFIPGLDLEMMYKDMFWASEGYLWEKSQNGSFDVNEVERDFLKLIGFWKKLYLRKEEKDERD